MDSRIVTVASLGQFRITYIERTAFKDARIVMGKAYPVSRLGREAPWMRGRVPAGQDGDRSRTRLG